MASKWAQRTAVAVVLLGGAVLAVQHIETASGTADPNERIKSIVQAGSVNGANTPLELSSKEIITIQPTTLTDRLRVSGELRPVNKAILRAQRGGRIIRIGARDGEIVRAGDVLVRFETGDLESIQKQREAERDEASADRLLAIQSLNRTEQLAAKKIASREQLEKVKAEVAAATARLDGLSAQVKIARTALQEADVRAPFDGVVANLTIDEGSYVGTDAELVSVVDTSVLEARMLVATRNVHRIAPGQPAELFVDGLEKQVVQGQVKRIGAVADDGSRFVPVYVQLANREGRLKGGMFATGSILVRQYEDMLVVPVTAVREDDAGNYVLKLENGLLIRQSVTIRSQWNGDESVEISDGLVQGDAIVTAPLPELRPNAQFTISKAG